MSEDQVESSQVINFEDALKGKIAQEINVALQRLGAPFELMCIVDNLGGTLSGTEVLKALQRYNSRGTIFDEIFSAVDPDTWTEDI